MSHKALETYKAVHKDIMTLLSFLQRGFCRVFHDSQCHANMQYVPGEIGVHVKLLPSNILSFLKQQCFNHMTTEQCIH
jgi:hypothetical protein